MEQKEGENENNSSLFRQAISNLSNTINISIELGPRLKLIHN